MDKQAVSLSVCIPVYNGEAFLKESIASVLAQDFDGFELVILDDASSDGSAAIAKSFSDPRIRFESNGRRLGLTGAWNRCLELARGKYVCIFHQDDIMMPSNLRCKYRALAQRPGAGMVYSNVTQIDSSGAAVPGHPFWRHCNPDTDFVWPAGEAFAHINADDNPVCCPGVMLRRSVLEKTGGFNPALSLTADWEMWMKVSLFSEVIYLREALFKYRWHEDNENRSFSPRRNLEQKWKARDEVLKNFSAQIPESGALRKKNNRLFSYQCRMLAKKEIRRRPLEAAACLLDAVKVMVA